MPSREEFFYDSADRITKIRALRWLPDEGTEPVAILQIVHGMQEFIDRYDAFATFMAEHGFIVVGNDMLGHGGSIRNGDERYWGYFGRGICPGAMSEAAKTEEVQPEHGNDTDMRSGAAEIPDAAGSSGAAEIPDAAGSSGAAENSGIIRGREDPGKSDVQKKFTPAYSGSPYQDAKTGGHRILVADIRTLQDLTIDQYPDLPCFMLGHSMGSFLAREFLCLHGGSLKGAVISGTAFHPAAETVIGRLLTVIIGQTRGWFYRSPLLNKMSIGNLNKEFEPARTPVDWLTRDEAVVDKYAADKRTQFQFTCNAYYALFDCLKYLTVSENLLHMPKSLPVMLIAGAQDPVGKDGDGPKRVAARLQGIGMKNVITKIYPQCRHEVLNELNKAEVWDDVLEFLEAALPVKHG